MKILANEFVLPFVEGTDCHANHFLPLDNGEILCVYFYGTKEGNDDVRIFISRRSAQGKWGEPRAITEDDGVPHWNPVLFRRDDGTIVLFYKVGKRIPNWVTRCMLSTDNGESWSESFEMIPNDTTGGRGPVRNKVVRLSDGTLLAPASTEQGEWKCFFDRSTDGGLTWERGEDLCVPAETLKQYESLNGKGIIQPTIWESKEGVHALMRSSEGAIYRTDSADGIHWCAPYATSMPNNNSGIDLDRLPDGRLVLACNPVQKNWGARSPISLYISEDNGVTFTFLTHLTTMPGEYSYPAVRYEDGKLHVTYTWNRKTVQYFCLSDI